VPTKPVKIKKPKFSNEVTRLSNNNDLDFPEREEKKFSIRNTFGLDLGPEKDDEGNTILDDKGNPKLKDKFIQGYESPTEHTPTLKPNYVFSKDETLAVLMGMTGQDPILLVGHTGTGKTSMIEQIAARLNFNCVKISFDGAVSRNDIIGEWVVKGKDMVYQYGIIPIAFRMPGTLIILDEWDAQDEETAFVLQRPLQKEDRKVFLLDTLELIPMHPSNIICATANTNGQGDDTGLYSQGTRVQSYAQLNRFAITVRLDYLSPEAEKKLINEEYPDLYDDETDSLVVAVNKVRDGFSNGQLSVPLSTRDLLNWSDKYLKFGDAMKAARFCFLNRMNLEDARVCEGIIQRAFEDR